MSAASMLYSSAQIFVGWTLDSHYIDDCPHESPIVCRVTCSSIMASSDGGEEFSGSA